MSTNTPADVILDRMERDVRRLREILAADPVLLDHANLLLDVVADFQFSIENPGYAARWPKTNEPPPEAAWLDDYRRNSGGALWA